LSELLKDKTLGVTAVCIFEKLGSNALPYLLEALKSESPEAVMNCCRIVAEKKNDKLFPC
ncbi:MAG: hypothetical protein ABIH42_02270, partial [Planctomycetota bacterium]